MRKFNHTIIGGTMGVAEAKKYIQTLHKRQKDPYLWPDYLTGLPDKAAIIKKLAEINPKLGEYAIAYVRIANIQPYLLKYGPNQHADVIQWAAASLQTGTSGCGDSFVGTLNTHDFIVVCKAGKIRGLLEGARKVFQKKLGEFYDSKDMKKGTILHFSRDNGETVSIGLMRLIAVIADRRQKVKRSDLVNHMGSLCDALEGTDKDILVIGRPSS